MPPTKNGWKRRIANAIATDGLGVAAQSIKSIPADGTNRLEILLQLHEGRCVTPAGLWIDAANTSPELMRNLDRWIMGWLFHNHDLREQQYWVNVSAHSLEDGRYQWLVGSLLERGGIRPEQLMIEVTEQADTGAQSLVTLKALRSFGCGIAIDDFGAGYNSALKLTEMPVTALKLTGDLCRAVEQHRQYKILQAFVSMGQSLGLEVVVEWVESEAQFKLLAGLGATLFQGWAFGFPQPMSRGEQSAQNLESPRATAHIQSHHPASSRSSNRTS